MKNIEAYKKELYQLRFSPMCKPAAEVANLTQIESHTLRARMLMLWRIAEGHLQWGPREAELLYQSTLDSISEAFDVFHYPISRYMLEARVDVWEAGLAPEPVKLAIENNAINGSHTPPSLSEDEGLVLAGEIAQSDSDRLTLALQAALDSAGIKARLWRTSSGALEYALGAHPLARQHAESVIAGLRSCQASLVIADGPETAWMLTKVYPALGFELPEGVTVKLLSVMLAESKAIKPKSLGKVFVHDSRSASMIATVPPNHLAVMPGYTLDEKAFGAGDVYEAPRSLVDATGNPRIFGTWTRGLAKSCGADDGLWLTYPDLASGLAGQRLDYAQWVGADSIVTDSPLCASYLQAHHAPNHPAIYWLPELLAMS
jgi:hypothetical protein